MKNLCVVLLLTMTSTLLANSSIVSKDSVFQSMNTTAHKSVGYDGARTIMFGELFILKDSSGSYVVDVYCEEKFHFKQVSDVGHMSTEVNIEHTWPQSKFSSGFDKMMQKSDMHHLYPTDSEANSQRGNHSFGDITGSANELNVKDCEESKLARNSGEVVFMPPKFHRGNVARSMFYFATRYKMTIDKNQEAALRKWHKDDPIDANEKARHEIIVRYQNTRNPFIDHPELVDQISDF